MGQLESFNPATGELIGAVETLQPDQVQTVVDDVAEVQPFWAQLTLADRSRYLRRAADVLVEEVDEVAELLTREQGKPITESYVMELIPTIDALRWCASALGAAPTERTRLRLNRFLTRAGAQPWANPSVLGTV